MTLGGERFVVGVVIVKTTVLDGPAAVATETFAVPGNATSCGRIAAVIWPELGGVVARCEPFQYTTEVASKFEPNTVSVNPVGLQYGVEDLEVVDAEIALIVSE